MSSNEARLHEILDVIEQAQKEGDKFTEAQMTALYKKESAPEYGNADMYDRVVGSIPGRAVLSLGKIGVLGPAQVGALGHFGGPFGPPLNIAKRALAGNDTQAFDFLGQSYADLEAAQKRGREAGGFIEPLTGGLIKGDPSEGFDWASLLGAGMGGAGAMVKGKAVPTLGAKIAEGSKIGSTFGLATPVDTSGDKGLDFGETKFLQTVLGGLAGGTISAIAGLGSNLVKIFRGLIGKAKPKQLAEIIDHYMGDKKARIMAEVEKYREAIPGDKPGVPEAAARIGSAEFSAFGKKMESLQPSETRRARVKQENVRAKAARAITGPKEVATLEEERRVIAEPLYEASWKARLDMSKGGKAEEAAITENPYYQIAAKKADTMQEAIYGSNLVENDAGKLVKEIRGPMTHRLHLVKEELDSMLAGTSDAKLNTSAGSTERALVTDLRTKINSFLIKRNPAYAEANSRYEKLSVPINQKKVNEVIESKLTGPLDHEEKARAYASELRNILKTARRVTGQKLDKITDLYDKTQIKGMFGIARALQRKARYEDLAREGGPYVSQHLSREGRSPTGKLKILDRAWVVMSSALNSAMGEATVKTQMQIAKVLADPKTFLEVARLTSPKAKAELGDLFREWGRLGAAGTAGSEVGDLFGN